MILATDKPLTQEADPYLSMNEKVAAVLSNVEEVTAEVEKAKDDPSFDPSLLRSILAALKGLTKAMADARDAKPPTITVEAPKIEIPPSNITIQTDTPKRWSVAITERDDNDRIKAMTIEAAK